MVITVPECFLVEHNINSDTVRVGQTHDDQCSGSSDPTMSDLLFTIDTDKCSIETTSNDTHISYTAILKSGLPKSNSVITRVGKSYEVDLRCDLAKTAGVTMHEFFVPLVSTVKIDAVASSASFEVDLSLYIDPEFLTPIGVGHEGKFNFKL